MTVGIFRAILSVLHKVSTIQWITQGQYMLVNDMPDELLSIYLRTEQLVFFFHENALFLHSISDGSPFVHVNCNLNHTIIYVLCCQEYTLMQILAAVFVSLSPRI